MYYIVQSKFDQFFAEGDKAKTTLLSPSREEFLPKENIERSASKTPDTLIAHNYI